MTEITRSNTCHSQPLQHSHSFFSLQSRLTCAIQTHQSSHQTFLVSFTREYILPTTNVIETISRIHVKAWTSPALFTSPPGGGGPVAGMVAICRGYRRVKVEPSRTVVVPSDTNEPVHFEDEKREYMNHHRLSQSGNFMTLYSKSC